MAKQLYTFREQRFTHFSHQIRVFIYGADVSAWLKDSVTITYGDRDSFNSCSFTLANPNQVWQLSQRNLQGYFVGRNEYSESSKSVIFNLKNDKDRNPFFNLDITLAQLGQKQNQQAALKADPIAASEFATKPKTGFYPPEQFQERRYRLAINDCIFNKHDPLRIFVRNPYASNRDEWVEKFCGFIQDIQITTDRITNSSSIRVNAHCIKNLMNKMRVTTSPMANEVNIDPTPLFSEGFFADFIKPGAGTHPFATTSLEGTIKQLILGTSLPLAEGMSKQAKANSQTGGVGNFSLGNIVCYNPESPGNTLETWHLMTLFGVNKVPYPKGGGADNLWLTNEEVNMIGKHTYPHADSPVGGPDARYLHFLLPSAGTGAGALVQSDASTASGPGTKEFTTRWEIIREFASKLDFQVITSPSGDLLVEFPQYGFTPEIYSSGKKLQSDPNIGRIFVFDIHQKEDTIADEAEDFPTVLTVSGGFAQQSMDVPNTVEGVSPRAYIYSADLVARYGVIAEAADFPFAGQRPDDMKGALTRRLGQLGLIEYTKRIANASSWSGSLVYRPLLMPNRPVYLKKNERIGRINTVTHTWTLGQEPRASTDISCNMLMAKRHDGSFRLLTGALNTPIDYASIWTSDEAEGKIQHALSAIKVKTSEEKTPAPEGAPQGSSPSATSEAQPGPIVTDLGALFPPFRKLVEVLLKEAKARGLEVIVGQTYRTPAQQNHVLAKGWSKAEAFLSYHQYGLAVDLDIRDDNGKIITDGGHQAFSDLNAINRELNLGLTWGGGWKSIVDPRHFQIPPSWRMNSGKARRIRENNVGKPEVEAVKAVWDEIYALNPILNDDGGAMPSSVPKDAAKSYKEYSQGGTFAIGDIPPAEECKDVRLSSPGLKKK